MLFKAVLREIDFFDIEMLFKACPERERFVLYLSQDSLKEHLYIKQTSLSQDMP
jgi:hypothetical protein